MPTMLSWVNLADTAEEITATRAAEGLGVRNLLTEPIGEVWRIPNVADGTLTNLDITLAAPAEIGVIALRAPHDSYLPPLYQVRIFASTVSVGAGDVFSTSPALLNLADASGTWWYWPETPVTLQYLRLQFVSGAGDDYLQFGRLWLGPDFRPARSSSSNGARRGMATAGGVERAAVSGSVTPLRGSTFRICRFALERLTNAEARTVEGMARAIGTHGQILVHPRTSEGAAGLVLGRLLELAEPQIVAPLLWGAGIAVAEDL